jgi:hypothetical protein
MALRADTWHMALLLPAGCAIAKTRVSAARTASDQGPRPRMIDHFNEPASRATSHERWTLFALSPKQS